MLNKVGPKTINTESYNHLLCVFANEHLCSILLLHGTPPYSVTIWFAESTISNLGNYFIQIEQTESDDYKSSAIYKQVVTSFLRALKRFCQTQSLSLPSLVVPSGWGLLVLRWENHFDWFHRLWKQQDIPFPCHSNDLITRMENTGGNGVLENNHRRPLMSCVRRLWKLSIST